MGARTKRVLVFHDVLYNNERMSRCHVHQALFTHLSSNTFTLAARSALTLGREQILTSIDSRLPWSRRGTQWRRARSLSVCHGGASHFTLNENICRRCTGTARDVVDPHHNLGALSRSLLIVLYRCLCRYKSMIIHRLQYIGIHPAWYMFVYALLYRIQLSNE